MGHFNNNKVMDMLLGMYPGRHEMHQWMEVHIGKQNVLVNANFEVGCLKEQEENISFDLL